ncbi:membrane fusion protein, multidrug efflux system [Sphingobium sp. AP50]|uniref:HlyD family secretion protein n=1 Tax=Sphingobium sp. AP50 TaxID=1884369 RepID=UPI0008C1C85F|nr:HlyD family secretion protein [Sphingobium sp. AP50]SEJ50247.1 membrane fusion protein, multidrug efflux system [Sphingobium sp. AP50]
MTDAAASSTNPPPTVESEESERQWVRFVPWIILVLVVVGVILATANWNRFEANRSVQTTDNATIQADSAVVDAKVSGYVRTVNFTDFQRVKAGDVLVQLDDREARAAVLHAESALAKSRAVLANLDHELDAQQAIIAQARAAVTGNASKLRLARADQRRFSALAESGAVTGQENDSAGANATVLEAAQAGSVAALDLQNRQLDVLRGQRAQREADVLAAQAALESARITLSYTRIVAPTDGIVGQRLVQLGSLLSPGSAVVNFVASTPPYVVANYKETQLARIAPGQRVDILVDSFPGERLVGHVSKLAPASGATFSALPADNATGNFTKVTQRIPLRIDLAPGQAIIKRLRAGMSVTTRIETRG